MSNLEALQKITTKKELASLLGVKTSFLTYSLYVLKPNSQYIQFKVPKKNGTKRTINAPTGNLKTLQSCLSNLLLNCIDDINKKKFPDSEYFKPLKEQIKYSPTLKVKMGSAETKQLPCLSHGFVRKRSIITNAMMHLGKKNVLNIDLENFFDSFNFGRVRGFFIKNDNFKLDPAIATVISQISCFNNILPQGSPCSPVITNLITHSLDIRLAYLAKKNSCTYSRYADDITFSTRKAIFPAQIMRVEDTQYLPSKKLRNEIKHAGFTINSSKTRIQYKDSRQDVTGLIVNKKPNIKSEYWRTVRAQCNSLFNKGKFTKTIGDAIEDGNINELEGQLNFIDHIDAYNRLRQKQPLNHTYSIAKHTYSTNIILNGREKTFSKFLYYRLFYGNEQPTFLCEGKTDNVYLKSAINMLANHYPKLATAKNQTNEYKLLVRFLEYSKRTRFLLELSGGTSYLNYFISKFDKSFHFYKAPKPTHPVILILDNDNGFKGKKDSGIDAKLKKIKSTIAYPESLNKHEFRKADFIHVMHNLYIVLTPLTASGEQTDIEDMFDQQTRATKLPDGKTFNPADDRDNEKEYGKEVFAQKIIKAQKSTINFNGLKPLLDRVVKAIEHYEKVKRS